jgi:hypothetical protein
MCCFFAPVCDERLSMVMMLEVVLYLERRNNNSDLLQTELQGMIEGQFGTWEMTFVQRTWRFREVASAETYIARATEDIAFFFRLWTRTWVAVASRKAGLHCTAYNW